MRYWPERRRVPTPRREPPPISAATDRNLLFGILALPMDFITRDALIDAMIAWILAKSRPIETILVERRALDPTDRDLLPPMFARHGDAQKSLAAMRGYPIMISCNSRYLNGIGFLELFGFKSLIVR